MSLHSILRFSKRSFNIKQHALPITLQGVFLIGQLATAAPGSINNNNSNTSSLGTLSCRSALAEGETGGRDNAKKGDDQENIFLREEPSSHPLNAIEFDKIQTSHFMPAYVKGFKEARKRSRALRMDTSPPTFENTIMALENMSAPLELVSTVFGNYMSFQTNPEIQALAQRLQPISLRLSNRISFNENVFKRVESLYNQRDSLNLNLEQQELLRGTYKGFLRSGINLPPEQKTRLKEIKERLAQLSLKYGDQLREYTNAYQLVIKNKRQLDGLPESTIAAAAQRAKNAKLEGAWIFTLDPSTYIDVVTYSNNRKLRERIWRDYNRKAAQAPHDNRPLVIEIARLRDEYAKILGYKTYGDFVVEDRMARNVDTINGFLDKLAATYKVHARKELEEVKAFSGRNDLKPWDIGYYSEKLKKSLFSVSDEQLRPYFNLDNVIQGALDVASKLYGIQFIPQTDIPTWDPSVKVFRVLDENKEDLALFYIDPFLRPSKRGGAWMNNLRSAGIYNGKMQRPHVINVYNLVPPNDHGPTLLTFDEVRTVFHELGHGLHGMLTQVESPSLSGTSVAWDAVELPSQIFENWAIEPTVLSQYAFHYKTGEALPADLVEKVQQAKNFQAGMIGLRQIMLGKIDLAFHGSPLNGLETEKDIERWERTAKAPYAIMKSPRGPLMATSFAHIFAGGYASGYYSYKWADVLASDAYSVFEDEGIFNLAVARRFREEILERGGVEKPDVLYRRFRGQDPDPDALLRAEGLIE